VRKRIKFQVKITDSTDTIEATIFAPPAEDLFQITGVEIMEGTLDGNLSMPLLHKLSVTHNCSCHLKAYMYDYGGIQQCKFNIQAFFLKPTTESEESTKELLLMAPDTQAKRPELRATKFEKISKSEVGEKSSNSEDMDQETENGTLHHNKKNA